MNQADFDKHVQNTLAACQRLLDRKGSEYSNSLDRLANFKRGAMLTGQPPVLIALIYASKHWDAIASYARKDANGDTMLTLSEPIEGRLEDLINYLLFIGALIKEKDVANTTVPDQ